MESAKFLLLAILFATIIEKADGYHKPYFKKRHYNENANPNRITGFPGHPIPPQRLHWRARRHAPNGQQTDVAVASKQFNSNQELDINHERINPNGDNMAGKSGSRNPGITGSKGGDEAMDAKALNDRLIGDVLSSGGHITSPLPELRRQSSSVGSGEASTLHQRHASIVKREAPRYQDIRMYKKRKRHRRPNKRHRSSKHRLRPDRKYRRRHHNHRHADRKQSQRKKDELKTYLKQLKHIVTNQMQMMKQMASTGKTQINSISRISKNTKTKHDDGGITGLVKLIKTLHATTKPVPTKTTARLTQPTKPTTHAAVMRTVFVANTGSKKAIASPSSTGSTSYPRYDDPRVWIGVGLGVSVTLIFLFLCCIVYKMYVYSSNGDGHRLKNMSRLFSGEEDDNNNSLPMHIRLSKLPGGKHPRRYIVSIIDKKKECENEWSSEEEEEVFNMSAISREPGGSVKNSPVVNRTSTPLSTPVKTRKILQ